MACACAQAGASTTRKRRGFARSDVAACSSTTQMQYGTHPPTRAPASPRRRCKRVCVCFCLIFVLCGKHAGRLRGAVLARIPHAFRLFPGTNPRRISITPCLRVAPHLTHNFLSCGIVDIHPQRPLALDALAVDIEGKLGRRRCKRPPRHCKSPPWCPHPASYRVHSIHFVGRQTLNCRKLYKKNKIGLGERRNSAIYESSTPFTNSSTTRQPRR
jgi:hypothetical protein